MQPIAVAVAEREGGERWRGWEAVPMLSVWRRTKTTTKTMEAGNRTKRRRSRVGINIGI